MADSAEQITESINRTGWQGKLEQVFQTAIARARGGRHKSSEPAINETREVDGDDAS